MNSVFRYTFSTFNFRQPLPSNKGKGSKVTTLQPTKWHPNFELLPVETLRLFLFYFQSASIFTSHDIADLSSWSRIISGNSGGYRIASNLWSTRAPLLFVYIANTVNSAKGLLVLYLAFSVHIPSLKNRKKIHSEKDLNVIATGNMKIKFISADCEPPQSSTYYIFCLTHPVSQNYHNNCSASGKGILEACVLKSKSRDPKKENLGLLFLQSIRSPAFKRDVLTPIKTMTAVGQVLFHSSNFRLQKFSLYLTLCWGHVAGLHHRRAMTGC